MNEGPVVRARRLFARSVASIAVVSRGFSCALRVHLGTAPQRSRVPVIDRHEDGPSTHTGDAEHSLIRATGVLDTVAE